MDVPSQRSIGERSGGSKDTTCEHVRFAMTFILFLSMAPPQSKRSPRTIRCSRSNLNGITGYVLRRARITRHTSDWKLLTTTTHAAPGNNREKKRNQLAGKHRNVHRIAVAMPKTSKPHHVEPAKCTGNSFSPGVGTKAVTKPNHTHRQIRPKVQ